MSDQRSDSGGVRASRDPRWASAAERGSDWALDLMVWGIRSLGERPLRLLVGPIAAYFFVFAGAARRSSRDYLARIDRARGGTGSVRLLDPYRHLRCFAEVILDRLALWAGNADQFHFELHGRQHMERLIEERSGAFLVGAHLGSFDMLRVIAREADIPVNVLMYSGNAQRINDAFERLDPGNKVRVIDLDSPAGTAFEVRRCLDRGEFVAVLGDRTRPSTRNRVAFANFLGSEARFPQGPFLLPLVLRAPVILTIALRSGRHRYDIYLETLAEPQAEAGSERGQDRRKAVQEGVERYASRLEHYCLKAPLQWFNFYDFWSESGDSEG